MTRIWKIALIAVAVLSLVAITVGAVALARGNEPQRRPPDHAAASAAGWKGSGGPGVRARLDATTQQQLRDLMAEHRADMQEWWKTYGEDPSSAEAQKALQQLREEHRAEMQKLRDDLGLRSDCRGLGRGVGDDDAAPPGGYGPGMMRGMMGGSSSL